MKSTVTLTLLLLCSLLFTAKAATFPFAVAYAPSDSTAKQSLLLLSPKALEKATGKKLHWYERWQLKIVQRKLAKQMQQKEHPISQSTKVLSVVSLAAVGLALLLMIAGSGLSFLLLLASLITGIIALAGNRNRGEKHRTMAILGIVLSGTIILLIVALIIAWAGAWA